VCLRNSKAVVEKNWTEKRERIGLIKESRRGARAGWLCFLHLDRERKAPLLSAQRLRKSLQMSRWTPVAVFARQFESIILN